MSIVESSSDTTTETLVTSGEIPGYPKIFSFGRQEASDIFHSPHEIIVQEKVDGSQFSFKFNGEELLFRSKSQRIYPGLESAKMFEVGMAAIHVVHSQTPLKTHWVYRGEYLQKPKHNSLAYDRVPKYHTVLFDIQDELGRFLRGPQLREEASRLGMETVPDEYAYIRKPEDITSRMDKVSFLGGQKIEGLVLKDWTIPLFVKHVSEAFKEVHKGDWRERHPTQGDIIAQIIASHRTPARWEKAVQHMRDRGVLLSDPRDIGPLMGEVAKDIFDEEGSAIKEEIFKYFWKTIARGVTRGLPEWYKEKLIQVSFEGTDENKTPQN